ncbi:type III-A CRISPR-associated protein Cas10/Csm1 [Thermodesulfovibrio yellowstonii]|uniref:CRISPR system single-strand-specific deoxyribonuclease Cas10/Csm1 (subtype III-A) n=1 Tax=Thermodesulfovibrio yellowstonii TaxID=28262 RepID=A0A9W6GHY1_9BACT|nr:type III-A CRISPR-associated protein Cas10/Csm1 [Thermodesulfovibrio islandicus]GLI53997.1 type III-A CRISPR-associated protein Cas10/Csm1 [Thermodesulfovibrio islandicus]
MVDREILKIAIAALLHDIGKFSERASVEIPQDYVINNQALYQPKYKHRYTHRHSLHTAYFFDSFSKYLPKQILTDSTADTSLINLAAMHHKPTSAEQLIIREADILSSGIERKEFEEQDAQSRMPKEIPLSTIFEDISINENWKENKPESFKFVYPLATLSPKSIFPVDKSSLKQIDYKILYEQFIELFKKLPHIEYSPLWFEHLDSLLFLFTSSIPSATVTRDDAGDFKEIITDISLYDHSRLTAAIATALYAYHRETNSINIDAIKDRDIEKFLLIEGNFYGIQDFIFSDTGDTRKNAAKLLRGRSFYVSLLSELASDFILEKIGLPSTSIVVNAAGKFRIILPNTERAIKFLAEAENEINDWLIKNFYGEVSIGISSVTASFNVLIDTETLSDTVKKLGKASEERKFHKFDVLKYAGAKTDYLDEFSSEFGICSLCNRRSARGRNKIDDEYLCDVCFDHVNIGRSLTSKDYIAITYKDADLRDKLRIPIYNRYQLAFITGKLRDLVQAGKVRHFWDINSLWQEELHLSKELFSIKLINAYVPRFTEEHKDAEILEKLKYDESEESIKEIDNLISYGGILSFANLGKLSLHKIDSEYQGVPALGVFKADVDNLGAIFMKGLRKEKRTFSRYTTLSRQLNLFFTLYVPYLCRTEFKNIYTVFTGGDDLFVIGPWKDTFEFALRVKENFSKYCCENKEISLSAGLFITKSETPVINMAKFSEEALDKAKQKGKNKLTVFDVSVSWDDLSKLAEIESYLHNWLEEEIITKAFSYKLNEIVKMVEEEIHLRRSNSFELSSLNSLTWRAKLCYSTIRNVAKGYPKDKRIEIAEEVLTYLSLWLEKYRESMRIPLWKTLYMRRKA